MATTTASGLIYDDKVVGTGAEAKAGQSVEVHYTGWLFYGGERGKKFDSSKDRGEPFEFPLGAGRVIKGWDLLQYTMQRHLKSMLDFYGPERGLVLFRKHASRYLAPLDLTFDQRQRLLTAVQPAEFLQTLAQLNA